MVINSDDKVCVIGLHRSGTSTIASALSTIKRKYCGEITSAVDFVKSSFPLDTPQFPYFTPWQELYSDKYPGIEKYESIIKRFEYVDQSSTPVVYKILVNELSDRSAEEIDHIKDTMLNHKVVFCVRPFRDIIISLLTRPAIRHWLVANKHHNVWPNGVEKDKFTDAITINVPYNKKLIEQVITQKPKHIHMMKHMKEFVANTPNHVTINYQKDLENHEWLKPFYDQSNQQYVKNPFVCTFDYDVDAIIDQIKNKCNYWY